MTKTEQVTLDKLWVSLYGNGKPGLKTDVELLKTAVAELKAGQERMETWLRTTVFAGLAIIGSGTVTIVIGLLTHTIHL